VGQTHCVFGAFNRCLTLFWDFYCIDRHDGCERRLRLFSNCGTSSYHPNCPN